MGTLWISDGKIVIDDGKIVVCDECPCGDDCYADVIAAIRERQAAVDRTVWDAAPSPDKSLADCITETNVLAPSFISGSYSGGASLPTMRTNSYATGAADFCVLYDLICALVTTVETFSTTSAGEYPFEYVASQAIPLWQANVSDSKEYSELIPIAQSQWARINYAGTASRYGRASLSQSGSLRTVFSGLTIHKMRLNGFPSSLSKSARIFLRPAAFQTYPYSGLGWHSLEQDAYSLIETVSAGFWSTVNLAPWPCAEPAPFTPAMPSSGPWSGAYEISSGGRIALIDWGFTHV